MEVLYKFCDKQFNLLNECNTLKIGTVKYYREMDPDFSISDSLEGITSGDTNGNPVIFNPEEMHQPEMIGPLFNIGPNANVTLSIGKGVSVESPNVFVFSCSLSKLNKSLPEYKSFYSIRHIKAFAQKISQLLSAELMYSDFKDPILRPSQMRNLQIECYFNKVEYLKKPLELTNKNKMQVIQRINDPIGSLFLKPENFKNDQEFRFIFCPIVDGIILSLKIDYKIIKMNTIDKMIFIS